MLLRIQKHYSVHTSVLGLTNCVSALGESLQISDKGKIILILYMCNSHPTSMYLPKKNENPANIQTGMQALIVSSFVIIPKGETQVYFTC